MALPPLLFPPRLIHEGLDDGRAIRLAQGADPSVAQGPLRQG